MFAPLHRAKQIDKTNKVERKCGRMSVCGRLSVCVCVCCIGFKAVIMYRAACSQSVRQAGRATTLVRF